MVLHDPPSGLRALVCIDDLTLGPAAGGIRTRAYESVEEALADGTKLARAMTIKCALAGVKAGGAKTIVLDHPNLDRARAFEVLGTRIDELGGLYLAAGDLGTTATDLERVAQRTAWVRTDEDVLGAAVARGLRLCLEVCAARRNRSLKGLRVAIQGCGAIGESVAHALAAEGAELIVADVDEARAARVASHTKAAVVDPEEILRTDADVLCPCGPGGVIDEALASDLGAWAVCGGANNILTSDDAGRTLAQRGILHVPDVVSSAGAVLQGVAETIMGLRNTDALFADLARTADAILTESAQSGESADVIASRMAKERITRCA